MCVPLNCMYAGCGPTKRKHSTHAPNRILPRNRDETRKEEREKGKIQMIKISVYGYATLVVEVVERNGRRRSRGRSRSARRTASMADTFHNEDYGDFDF
mmetsp:Transcript_54833/g.59444  ORF Transcript_54833/g.59444 Transcript_54833/m.59444 type:complete len:99 (+) Transcript_54833:95-391(+)